MSQAAPRAAAPPPRADGRARATTAVAVVVILGSIMTVLDVTVVNVALNHLSQDLEAPLQTIQWVATGYTLALATAIPVTGWAIGRIGARRLYVLCLAVFCLGSALAGLAWNVESLVAFRIVQGLGGGMIMPTGMTMLIRAADPSRVGRTMSVLGVPLLVGPAAGPVLGGWLVDAVSWRCIFLINLPIGVLALVLAVRLLRPDGPRPVRPLDVPGLLLLSPGLALLVYALARGAERGDLGSASVLAAGLLGTAAIVAFGARAVRVDDPLIDLRVFRRRAPAAAAATLALFCCGYFGSLLLGPLYFQLVLHRSAMGSGLSMIPLGVAAAVAMQVGGRLIDRMGAGRVVLVGVPLAAAGIVAFTLQLGAHADYPGLGAALLVLGTGVGLTIMPTITAATRALRDEEVPGASAALNIDTQVAASIGTALISVVLTGAIAARVPAVDVAHGLGAVARLSPSRAAAVAPDIAAAFRDAYWWGAASMLAAVLPALLLPRARAAHVRAKERSPGVAGTG